MGIILLNATRDHIYGGSALVQPRREKRRVSARLTVRDKTEQDPRRRCGCVRSLRLMSDMLAQQSVALGCREIGSQPIPPLPHVHARRNCSRPSCRPFPSSRSGRVTAWNGSNLKHHGCGSTESLASGLAYIPQGVRSGCVFGRNRTSLITARRTPFSRSEWTGVGVVRS